jgi:1-carboxybiuret hydrolase
MIESARDLLGGAATDLAGAVRAGTVTARAAVEAALGRIESIDRKINAFTDVTVERGLARADTVDRARAAGASLGNLAGVPFAVKNLFDVVGLPTRAGSKINRERAPAVRDAALIRRLEAAGAILIGALNMGEYAYDFTGENVHDGPSRNPHALDHMSGGSSGGSGAAVAAGLVPFALGSDTNGSIRVPSAFCGVFGLKPTYGRLTRAGTFPFVSSLDHLGPLARSVADLAAVYDAMQGHDPDDDAAVERPPDPSLPQLDDAPRGLRVATAGGSYFANQAEPDALATVERCARVLDAQHVIEVPEIARARAAAYLITAAEGAALHLGRLRTRAGDFDPAVRDRLIAGATIPAAWIVQAQRFRRWFHAQVLKIFERVDIILAPATPCRAPRIGQKDFALGGVTMPVRPNLGVFTQPFSLIGLPVVAVPVWLEAGLPLGVQVIAPPWREARALQVARILEREGVARAPVAELAP